MDYNFSGISVDTITDVEKKLAKVCQALLDDINNFIIVLNNQRIIDAKGELNIAIKDILRDEIKKSAIGFTGAMNKIQVVLAEYL